MNCLPASHLKSVQKTIKNFRYGRMLGLLAFFIILIYSNSLQSSWHLDDYENITGNPRVMIQDLTPQTLRNALSASPEGRPLPYRSLAYLSFALNAFYHGTDVAGYHAVNIIIHIITAVLLFATVMTLFSTPRLAGIGRGDAYFIALLTAFLWAVNPIQTQAVTYIVQRMASLAAMFYLLGVHFYLAARLSKTAGLRIGLLILCGLSYVCAIFTKENAALLPITLLFIEFIFFRDIRYPRNKRVFIGCLCAGVFLVVLVGVVLFGNPLGFLNGYPYRTFTPIERLLTEARVLVFYLSQIFYPIPMRLSLYHDFPVSVSLFDPWTTMPCLLIIAMLLGAGFFWMGRRPVLSFAILFFIFNHLIESSVIGLELVFEHRNYLPSLFLFMPAAQGIKRLINHYEESQSGFYRLLNAAVVLLVIGLGTGTYVRNLAWANEKTLWEDTLFKAPHSIRAHHELAYQYYEKSGQYDAALALYHRGLELSGQNIYEKTLSLNNIASIHFSRGEYDLAELYWKKAIASFPQYEDGYYRLGLTQTKLGKWREASETLSRIVHKGPVDAASLRLRRIISRHNLESDTGGNSFENHAVTPEND
jgi:protein O-mannosyl-transferase